MRSFRLADSFQVLTEDDDQYTVVVSERFFGPSADRRWHVLGLGMVALLPDGTFRTGDGRVLERVA